MSVVEFLKNTKINSCIFQGDKPQEIVKVWSSEKFHTVLWRLLSKNVSSAPVFEQDSGKFVGMVDLLDLLTYALVTFEESKLLPDWTGDKLDANDAKSLTDLSLRHPAVLAKPDDALVHLFDLFGKNHKMHRVPIVNAERELVGLVSQSDVLRVLASAWTKFDLQGTVGEWARKDVVTVSPSDNAAKAFEKIIDHVVTAVPIVDDETGAIVGTLSATDLKGAPLGSIFQFLGYSVATFKDQARTPVRAQCTAQLGEPLCAVFERFVQQRVHRLWVLDDDKKLVGVISLTDLVTKFAEMKQ